MKKSIIASAIAMVFTNSSYASEVVDLDEVSVKSNGFERKEIETTYASEIHTANQIEASGASTLYDFLAQQTSLNIVPNIGNKATPSVNLRGFGSESGFQNVVIVLDGQRLNNIDLTPQLLAGISVGNIERIEISKGSGSVLYGDGATAGTIQIYTKTKSKLTASTSWGNFGQKNHYLNAGLSEQYIDLSMNLAHDSHDGFSKKDPLGNQDQFTSNSQSVKVKVKPSDSFRLLAQANSSRNDVFYVSPFTLARFNANPRIAQGNYTNQSFDTNQWQLGFEFDITEALQLKATHFNEDKFSEFISATPSSANSIYRNNDIALRYQNDVWSWIAGYQDFDGERKSFSNFGFGPSRDTTTKNNQAFYLQTEYAMNNWRFSAGARGEQVRYRFSPLQNPFGLPARAQEKQDIDAWDVGVNYQFDAQTSAFANVNQSYQAPDIDRLFNFSGGFNGIIAPAKVQTHNMGLNTALASHKLKATVYYADLKNEIYLVPVTFENTNLDASHKYGLELQDVWKVNEDWSASLLYNYTRARIDHEDKGNGRFNGKDLPGVSKHSVVANVNWQFYPNASLNLNHTWRSKAYAFNDFANNFNNKQDAYETTNLALNYQFQRYTLFASVNNLFDQENYIQVGNDNGIYPIDFLRTWRVGMRADF